MHKLREYYEAEQKKLIIGCIAIWVLFFLLATWLDNMSRETISRFFAPDLQTLIQVGITFLFTVLSPTAMIGFFYFRRLKAIDTKHWKRQFPEYDVSGEWESTTTTLQRLSDKARPANLERDVPARAQIEQTCRSIKINFSYDDKVYCQSVLADWGEKGELHNLYEAKYYGTYRSTHNYPESCHGYECLRIDAERDSDGKPLKMRGHFWSCISPEGKTVSVGDIVYKRSGYTG